MNAPVATNCGGTAPAPDVVVPVAEEPAYLARHLAGRCASGAEGGRGRLFHAVPRYSGTALCGATYGRRSAGWSQWPGDAVTCPRCLRKLSKEAQ